MIDRVRDWGNIFTGNTGFAIARALADYRPTRVYEVLERRPADRLGESDSEIWVVRDVQRGK